MIYLLRVHPRQISIKVSEEISLVVGVPEGLDSHWQPCQEKERLQRQKDAAKKILPLLKDFFGR